MSLTLVGGDYGDEGRGLNKHQRRQLEQAYGGLMAGMSIDQARLMAEGVKTEVALNVAASAIATARRVAGDDPYMQQMATRILMRMGDNLDCILRGY